MDTGKLCAPAYETLTNKSFVFSLRVALDPQWLCYWYVIHLSDLIMALNTALSDYYTSGISIHVIRYQV